MFARALGAACAASILILLGALAVPAAAKGEEYRFSIGKTDDGSEGWTLRKAVEYVRGTANSAVITFDQGVRGQIELRKPLPITSEVTIVGPGAGVLSISGGDSVRIFEVEGKGDLTVSGLTLTRGRDAGEDLQRGAGTGMGGAILNRGEVSLRAVTLSSNSAIGGHGSLSTGGAAHGGAIMNLGRLRIQEGVFYDNVAQGGANEIQGSSAAGTTHGEAFGGAIRNEGSLTLVDSELRGNSALGGDGADIYSPFGATGTNGGDAKGGAIFNGADADAIRIAGSTLAGNRARGGPFGYNSKSGLSDGGAIYSRTAGLVMERSTVTGNRMESPGQAGRGAGLTLDGAPQVLRSSTIVFNAGPDVASGPTAVGAPGYVISSIVGSCGGGTLASIGLNLEYGSSCGFSQANDKRNTDARLGPLGQQGGPTRTMPIYVDSPALDQGFGSDTDQRGAKRPVSFASIPKPPSGNGADIGAFEAQSIATVSVAPEALDFGEQRVGASFKLLEAQITNTGGASVRLGDVTISGEAEDDFQLTSQTCRNATLQGGESCRVRVRFLPNEPGKRAATLRVPTGLPTGPAVLTLVGVGVEPPAALPGAKRKRR